MGQEKTVLIEICHIRGVFMVKTCKTGIQEINSPHFLLFFMIFQFFEMKKQGFILTLYFVTKSQNYASRIKDFQLISQEIEDLKTHIIPHFKGNSIINDLF